MVLHSYLLATLSIAEPPESIIETPSNQGKNNQPKIAAAGVYFILINVTDMIF